MQFSQFFLIFCDFLSQLNSNLTDLKTFSTIEQACGTWIDGSTIYKRSFEMTKSSDTSITLATIDGIALIGAEGSLTSNKYTYLVNHYESSGHYVNVQYRSDTNAVYLNSPDNNYGNGVLRVTIYYIYN